MSFTPYDASAPIFVKALTNMQAWLDKAVADGKSEAALMEAQLAPDMWAFPAQYRRATEIAEGAVAKLAGVDAPAMGGADATFADLKARCQRAIDFIQSAPASAFDGAETRPVRLRFPNGMGYEFVGADYLTGYVLPNFFFHVTTAYALLRANGVVIGKPDFLAHLGRPINMDAA